MSDHEDDSMLLDPVGGRTAKAAGEDPKNYKPSSGGGDTIGEYEAEHGFPSGSVTDLPENPDRPWKDPDYRPAYERRKPENSRKDSRPRFSEN